MGAARVVRAKVGGSVLYMLNPSRTISDRNKYPMLNKWPNEMSERTTKYASQPLVSKCHTRHFLQNFQILPFVASSKNRRNFADFLRVRTIVTQNIGTCGWLYIVSVMFLDAKELAN